MLGLLKVFIADPTRISNEHAHTTAWSAHTDKTGPTDVPSSFRDVLEERDKEQRGKRSPLSKCEFHVRYCHYIEAGRWLQQAEDLPVTFFFFFVFFLGCTRAYGNSWARGRIGATVAATGDLSHICNLHHSSQQRQILDPLGEARDPTQFLMDTSRVCYR